MNYIYSVREIAADEIDLHIRSEERMSEIFDVPFNLEYIFILIRSFQFPSDRFGVVVEECDSFEDIIRLVPEENRDWIIRPLDNIPYRNHESVRRQSDHEVGPGRQLMLEDLRSRA